MRTLIINTYAGSLLLGANAIPDARIIGSYEDSGFGAKVTRANRDKFKALEPDFEFVDFIKQWPDQDLTDVHILAHPPCAAFSNQNRSAAKRGTETEAFECTRKVLKYGMSNNAASISVESVMGALTGAWDVYDHMAEAGGYHVYRILQNAILFGVPQYRERCWHVLVRKGTTPETMIWRLQPKMTTIGATVDSLLPGTPFEDEAERLEKYVRKLGVGCICGADHGISREDVHAVALSHLMGHKRLGFGVRLAPFFPGVDPKSICRSHVSRFTSGQPSVLAESSWAPVLLGTSFWIYRGRPLPQEAYKAIMGFPTDYVFPPDTHYGVRTFLSKGVCPPVATWILDNVRMHFGEASASPFTAAGGYAKTVQPGHIASFRPGRNVLLDKLEIMDQYGMPEDDELIDLRDEEEGLEA